MVMATEAAGAAGTTGVSEYCLAVNKGGSLNALTFDSDGKWPTVWQPQEIKIVGSPALVNFQGKHFCLHQGAENGELWCGEFTYSPGPHSYLDWGVEVVLLNLRMTESPAAVVFNDMLYCLYRGTDGCLWYTTFDGLDWGGATKVDPEVGVTESPAAVVYQGKLFCLHQGAANDGWLWCTSFDGVKWERDKATHYGMSKSPGAVVYQNNILVVRQGKGEVGTTWWGYRDPNGYWLEDQQMTDVGTTDSPALVVQPGSPEKVYCLHRGSGGSHDIWLTSFDGASWTKDVKKMSDDAISGSPAVLQIT